MEWTSEINRDPAAGNLIPRLDLCPARGNNLSLSLSLSLSWVHCGWLTAQVCSARKKHSRVYRPSADKGTASAKLYETRRGLSREKWPRIEYKSSILHISLSLSLSLSLYLFYLLLLLNYELFSLFENMVYVWTKNLRLSRILFTFELVEFWNLRTKN